MKVVNLSGSVWSDGSSSVFVLIVTNLATGRGFLLESNEDEEIKTCLDSKRYEAGTKALQERFRTRIERLKNHEYAVDGEFDENLNISTPKQSAAGLSRLCSFFGDDCASQLSAIWKALLKDAPPQSRAQTYQIRTKHISLGTW